jgi:mitochondrial fission protein ELM1
MTGTGAAHESEPTAREPRSGTPVIWVLADDKLGHTTQSVGLAEALGWPYEVKELRFNSLNGLSNRLLGASLVSLDRQRSAALTAPWPQLVIATGRRTVPVARWIGRRLPGRIRLVQIGRKGMVRADHFDLSVACAHYSLLRHPRRMETLAPLTAIDDRRLSGAAMRWRDLFGAAPRPHVALIVGGRSALHQLDAEAAAHMARDVAAFARSAGGSLYVVTSPRTGSAAVAALRGAIGDAGRCYEWRPRDPDNPYLGCLAIADVLVVTGDSESMLAEAASTGKPLYIYPLPARRGGLRQRFRIGVGARARRAERAAGIAGLCAWLIESGVMRAPRDLAAMHARLIEAGHAHAFGAPLWLEPRRPLRELNEVAERVRALLDRPTPAAVD